MNEGGSSGPNQDLARSALRTLRASERCGHMQRRGRGCGQGGGGSRSSGGEGALQVRSASRSLNRCGTSRRGEDEEGHSF